MKTRKEMDAKAKELLKELIDVFQNNVKENAVARAEGESL